MSERPTTADVRREDRDTRGGRWTIVIDGHESEMTYSRASPTLIIIDHTGVHEALRGRGVGFKIIPLCPFAKAQFLRHKEWQDVLSA